MNPIKRAPDKLAIDYVCSLPEHHPMFKYVTAEKVELAMAFVFGLAERNSRHATDKNCYQFIYNRTKFAEKVKSLKPIMDSLNYHALGLRMPTVKSTEWKVYCRTNTWSPTWYILMNHTTRVHYIHVPHETLLFANWRDYLIMFSAVLPSEYMYLKKPRTELLSLSEKLRAFQALRTETTNCIARIEQEFASKRWGAFDSTVRQLKRQTESSNQILKRLTAIDHVNWGNVSVKDEEQACITYKKVIESKFIYKNADYEDRNIETQLLHPYLMYDLTLTYKVGGLYPSVSAKGYHPNMLADQSSKITAEKDVCIGTFPRARLRLTDDMDVKKFKEALNDLVLTLKTVNLASAYWTPKDDGFLETFQEYLTKDVLNDVPPLSRDEAYTRLLHYVTEKSLHQTDYCNITITNLIGYSLSTSDISWVSYWYGKVGDESYVDQVCRYFDIIVKAHDAYKTQHGLQVATIPTMDELQSKRYAFLVDQISKRISIEIFGDALVESIKAHNIAPLGKALENRMYRSTTVRNFFNLWFGDAEEPKRRDIFARDPDDEDDDYVEPDFNDPD